MDPASLASGGPPGADDPGAAMGLREQVAPSTVWPSTRCAHAVTYLALDSAAAIEQARTHLHPKLDLQGDARCVQKRRPSYTEVATEPQTEATEDSHAAYSSHANGCKMCTGRAVRSRCNPQHLAHYSRIRDAASPRALQPGAVRKRKHRHVPATMIAAAPGRTIIAS